MSALCQKRTQLDAQPAILDQRALRYHRVACREAGVSIEGQQQHFSRAALTFWGAAGRRRCLRADNCFRP